MTLRLIVHGDSLGDLLTIALVFGISLLRFMPETPGIAIGEAETLRGINILQRFHRR
jgi:hypothetical protein